MLPSKQVLADLIGRVYEAAVDATLWESFLEQVAKISRADASGLVMHDFGRQIHTISASWRLDPQVLHLIREYYGPLDVWAIAGRWKPEGWVGTSPELCRIETLKKTEVYNDLMVPFDIEHAMFGIFQKNREHLASISLFRSASSEEFQISDLDILRFLTPHMQRAFKLHFQFSELKARADQTENALNMLSTGVIFLGDSCEIVLLNRSADELLRRKDGLRLEQRKLTATLCSESAALQSMIAAAVQTSNGKGLSAGGTILVTREMGRPLSLTVAPLRNSMMALEKPPAAVLFISDPDQRVEVPADVLQRCYALTRAEARLAMLLLEGRSLNEAADTCAVTRNTAKSQLKSIFSKTQVQRQGELIKLILLSVGQLRAAAHKGAPFET